MQSLQCCPKSRIRWIVLGSPGGLSFFGGAYCLGVWVTGLTPLMAAARRGKVSEIGLLLAARADPTIRNRQGHTALDLARVQLGGVVPLTLEELLTASPH